MYASSVIPEVNSVAKFHRPFWVLSSDQRKRIKNSNIRKKSGKTMSVTIIYRQSDELIHIYIYKNAFYWTKMLEFRFKFFWNLPLMVQLVHIMAWRPTGDKPLPEPRLTQLTDTCMRHSVLLIHNERHFTDDIYQIIFLYGNWCILIRISPNIVPMCPKTKFKIGFMWKDVSWANVGLDYWRMYPPLSLDNSRFKSDGPFHWNQINFRSRLTHKGF